MKTNPKMLAAASVIALASMPGAVQGMPQADGGNMAQLLVDMQAAVDGLRDDVMKTADDALKAAHKSGTVTDELKAQVDQMLPQWNTLNGAVTKIQEALEGVESRTLDVEQLVAQGGAAGGKPVTAGRELAESEEMKAYLAAGLSGSMSFKPQAAITTADGSGSAWVEQEAGTVLLPQRQLNIRDLLSVSSTGREVIEYMRMTTRTNAAAMVAQAGTMPESNYGRTKQTVNIKKIAHIVNATDESLADIGELTALIDTEMRYGLALTKEAQILSGDGTGENLSGLITNATSFVAPSGLPDTNAIERLRLAILQVTLNDYAADGFVLNPTDWAGIELTKDGDGRFIIGNADAPAGARLWALPVVQSNTQAAGTWLCGAMRMAATLYERQAPELLISSEHGTNFVEGMKTVRGTERCALAVKRPTSLISGNFTFA